MGSPFVMDAIRRTLYNKFDILHAYYDTYSRASVDQQRPYHRSEGVGFSLQQFKLISDNMARRLQYGGVDNTASSQQPLDGSEPRISDMG